MEQYGLVKESCRLFERSETQQNPKNIGFRSSTQPTGLKGFER